MFIVTLGSGCAWMTDAVAQRFFLPNDGVRAGEYAVRTTRDAVMATSDGISLAADVHAPVGLETTPTILVSIPFNDTRRNRVRADSIGRYWARRGYTVVVEGTRGRYRSGGEFYPAVNERRDGLETIAWLKTQPWYDGRLAMWGGSAFGHTQWAVADQEGLDAFAVQITSTSYFNTIHPGGAFALESALYWGLISPPEKDRLTTGEEIQSGAEGWPVVEADDRALQNVAFFDDWATDRSPDAYWLAIDGENRALTVKAPISDLTDDGRPNFVGLAADTDLGVGIASGGLLQQTGESASFESDLPGSILMLGPGVEGSGPGGSRGEALGAARFAQPGSSLEVNVGFGGGVSSTKTTTRILFGLSLRDKKLYIWHRQK